MPVVWLIEAYRAGERSQIRALAEALGWPFEVKQFSYRKYEFLTNIFRGSDLRGIRIDQSSPLQAPWPNSLSRYDRAVGAGRTISSGIAPPFKFTESSPCPCIPIVRQTVLGFLFISKTTEGPIGRFDAQLLRRSYTTASFRGCRGGLVGRPRQEGLH